MLGQWGIRSTSDFGESLLDQAEVMLGWKPEHVQSWLMPHPDDNADWQLGEDWLGDGSGAEKLAGKLTVSFIDKLQAEFPQLGPPVEDWE